MADQMVAGGQGDALKAMEKSIPMGEVGRPEEIANAVLWLCSEAASDVTSQSISVDGQFRHALSEAVIRQNWLCRLSAMRGVPRALREFCGE